MVFAIPVPTIDKIAKYPNERKSVSLFMSNVTKKSVKAKTTIAGTSNNKKLPVTIESADTSLKYFFTMFALKA